MNRGRSNKTLGEAEASGGGIPRGPHSVKALAHALHRFIPCSGAVRQFPSPAEHERAELLHALFVSVRSRLPEGRPMRKLMRDELRQTKRVRLSLQSVCRHFIRWLSDPRPQTLLPRWLPGTPPLPEALVLDTLRRYAQPGVTTFGAAVRSLVRSWEGGDFIKGVGPLTDFLRRTGKLKYGTGRRPRFPFNERSFSRRLSADQRRAVKQLHASRLALHRAAAAEKQCTSHFVELLRCWEGGA